MGAVTKVPAVTAGYPLIPSTTIGRWRIVTFLLDTSNGLPVEIIHTKKSIGVMCITLHSRELSDGPTFCPTMSHGIASGGTQERFRSAPSCFSLVRPLLFAVLMGSLSLSTGCPSVQSSVEAIVTGEPPTDPTYAGRQHFPVTPREAVQYLIDIAPHEGWQVISTGEEYSTQGIQGIFFRLELVKPTTEKRALSGIFYAEPSGSYVRVSEQNGLPESLVEPLIAAIKKNKRTREKEDD